MIESIHKAAEVHARFLAGVRPRSAFSTLLPSAGAETDSLIFSSVPKPKLLFIGA